MSAERFIEALRQAEQTQETEALARMFAPGAELRRMTQPQPEAEHPGPVEFWRDYLDNFAEIRSDFTAVTQQGQRAVLEWISEGRLRGGEPIRYSGVSVLEFDGGAVRAFRTYYDSAAFLPAGRRLGQTGKAEGGQEAA